GVVIPGGYAPDHIRRHAKANEFVRNMDRAGKLVASICHGPWVLCSAGVLRKRKATCFFAIKDDVVNAGAIWEDAEVVVDGNLGPAGQAGGPAGFLPGSYKGAGCRAGDSEVVGRGEWFCQSPTRIRRSADLTAISPPLRFRCSRPPVLACPTKRWSA